MFHYHRNRTYGETELQIWGALKNKNQESHEATDSIVVLGVNAV